MTPPDLRRAVAGPRRCQLDAGGSIDASRAFRWWALFFCGTVMGLQALGAPISITSTQALAFGKFAAGSGGAVTVGWTGTRSAAGGVVLLASGAGSAAQFGVSGDASTNYAVTLPANGAVVLSSGANTMAVTGFSSNRGGGGHLGLGGTQAVSVGATLNVATGQVPGNYTGSFSISVDYN